MSDIFTTSPDKKDRPLAGRRAVQSTSPNEDSEIPGPGAAATGELNSLAGSGNICAILSCKVILLYLLLGF